MKKKENDFLVEVKTLVVRGALEENGVTMNHPQILHLKKILL